ncbi:MAG: hypothetical protein K0S11_776 [Gammaproteobacteria bacterium]|jgi:cholesterol transport system auxiliary component|nr:hypothetical protein [Gammaproteobacteria bacterium]
MRNLAVLILFSLSFAGCAVFKPVPRQTINTYELSAVAKLEPKPLSTPLILFVNQTLSSPGYETNGIAYSKTPYQLNYYSQNRWVAPPAQLINKALVNSLQQSQYFKAIATAPFVGVYDLRLDTRLLELKQDLQNQPKQIVMVLAAQLVDVKQQTILASKQFTVKMPTHDNPQAAVVDANLGLGLLLDQVIQFCVKNVPVSK